MPTGEATTNSTTVVRWFVFTDIEGSTSRWEHVPTAMAGALERHDAALTTSLESLGGHVFKHTGDGVLAAFADAEAAVRAAVAAQQALAALDFDDVTGLRVRIGIHGGPVHPRGNDYFGPVLNRASRVMDAGHGGQIVVTAEVAAAAAALTDHDVSFLPLGLHRLKGIAEPVALAQVRHPGLPVIDAPLRTQNVTAGNLAAPLGELLGRDDVLGAVDALLAAPGVVSLVGPGGAGKTAAALHCAHRARHRFPDGVWFCDLAALHGDRPGEVNATVAAALGIVRRAPLSLEDTTREALAGATLLVVLDNCEHLLAEAAATARLLTEAPGVRVLATSRQPLGIGGERRVRIGPLAAEHAGADLFLARAAGVGAVVGDDERPLVERIVAELDGLPLAIELAAARTSVFSVPELAERLGQRLRLLRAEVGNVERHHALAATIGWSYDLLETDLRRVLDALGAFHGGFTRDAVQAVTGLDDLDAADAIDALVARSLVEPGTDLVAGSRRFRLLETIRHFAAERLASSPAAAAVAAAHASYFATLATEGKAARARDDAIVWLQREYADLANLRAAFSHHLRHEPRRAAQMAIDMWNVWTSRSQTDEGAQWLRDAAAALPPDDPLSATVQDDLASMEWTRGGTADSERRCREAIAVAEARGVEPRPTVLLRLASICASTSRRAEALELLDRTVRLYRAGYEPTDQVEILSAAAAVAAVAGDVALGARLADEGIAVARTLGPGRLTSALFNGALGYVGSRPADAVAAAEESHALAVELGSRYGQGNALFALGVAHLELGNETRAWEALVDSLAPLRDSGQRGAVLNSLDRLIIVLRRQQPAGAVTLTAAVAALRVVMDGDDTVLARRRDRLLVHLHGALPEDEFGRAWDQGLRLKSVDLAIEEALRLAELLE